MFHSKNIKLLIGIISFFFLLFNLPIISQNVYDTAVVDTVAIKYRKEFNVDDFIKMTIKDTSFYRAFKNLKMFPHISHNEIEIFDKEWDEVGRLNRDAEHFSNGIVGWIEIIKENTNGKVYKKNGTHKYFTAEMYDKVFFEKGEFSVNNSVKESYSQEKMKGLSTKDKYYEKLKTFMFSPGTKIKGVPFIGKKLDIFSERMSKYYDFTIEKTFFKDTVPCYKFSCRKKEDVSDKKITITRLITFYDRRTMNIIARSYALKDITPMFSFDMSMFIQLNYNFGEYLPANIKYSGEWDVPFKKGERIKFEMKCSDYRLPKDSAK